MAYKTLILSSEGGVGTITLDRPEALNALNTELLGELADALTRLDTDADVGCIVLQGSEKAFAAGADIKEMAPQSFEEVFTKDLFGPIARAFHVARTPVIAAVSGYALGGGCELAMMCDFVICADNAKFGQPEIKLAVIPGIGGSQRLTRLVGKSKAMDMILTGRMMDAEEAERSGLASRVVPADELEETVQKIAAGIAKLSRPSVMAAKEAVDQALETGLAEGLLFERRLFHSLFATEDQKEGMNAFAEKRSPNFKNK